ncbi:MAG TPA: nuclear transport factor 2 family protein [Blastocatellia bacterium]|jgi:beta-aspartyl-peptidase (threonine type)
MAGLFIAASFLFTSSQASSAGLQGAPDEKAIKDLLARQVEAWNRGDLEGFMTAYSKSSDLTFFSGQTSVSGWQTMLDRYHARYKADGREMGRLEFTDLRVDMLGSQNALVRGRWHLKMKTEQPGGLFTLIMRKINGEWRIIHDHTS